MIDWGPGRRLRYGVLQGAGLGFVAGGLEAMGLAATLRLPLSLADFALLGTADVLVMGLLGALLALASGAVLHPVLKDVATSRALAIHLGAVGALLCGWFLWQGAADLLAEGRTVGALAMGAMPIGFWGVVYFNAGYWLRKVEIGAEYRVSWWMIGLGGGLLLALGAAGAYQGRSTGGEDALEGDRNIVLVTVDTLRRDHVGPFGDRARTPNIDRLAAEGVVFLDAVTPMPETAPAHASMMTGFHPLRHKVLSNGHRLASGHTTLAEVLEAEGYATGAFVSSFAVTSRTGLAQGFRTYDDDLAAAFPGLAQINVLQILIRGWTRFGDPASTPWLLERSGAVTTQRFLGWLDRHQDVPFFAWIHYFEPHAPYDGAAGVDHRARMAEGLDATYTEAEREALRAAYAREVEQADRYVGQVIDALRERGLMDRTMVVLTSDHGEMLGEHGLDFHHLGLYDEVVRVPLVLWVPGREQDFVVRRVEPQVRLFDLAPTIAGFLEIDAFEETEGVELLGYPLGLRKRTIWSSLVGHTGRSIVEEPLLGLRNNGVKYVRNLATGEESLFAVNEDPAEQEDLIGRAEATLEGARGLLGPEERALRAALEGGPPVLELGEGEMLDALGYRQ